MLRIMEYAIVPAFLETTAGGLLLVYDESNRTTHLGWIVRAGPWVKGIRAELGLTVVQKFGESVWERLESFTFEVTNIVTYTALEHCGGYHCSDSSLQGPTFKIYPAEAIPAEYVHDYDQLVKYGWALR